MIDHHARTRKRAAQFPSGSRIEMIRMSDDPCPVAAGERGTVTGIDSMGTLQVTWDSGRSLGVVLEDTVRVI